RYALRISASAESFILPDLIILFDLRSKSNKIDENENPNFSENSARNLYFASSLRIAETKAGRSLMPFSRDRVSLLRKRLFSLSSKPSKYDVGTPFEIEKSL